jgi:CubicO group peptidase (beta-lactamase class C family)
MNAQSLTDSHLLTFAEQQPAPHIVCGICQEGDLLSVSSRSAAGFAALANPAQTRFRIASMTKSFAAAAILKLRDEGRLQLEGSVTDCVPELALTGRWRDVTIRDLLGMRGGLPATDDPWADRKLSEPASFLNSALLNSAHFSNDPGEEYQYSNLGYMLLGRVISNAAQMPALEYVRDQFLQPLGMNETSWAMPAEAGVAGYRLRANGFEAETQFDPVSDLAVFAGLCSTLRDLAIWVRFMTDAHRGALSPLEQVLAARSRREMQRMRTVMHPIDSTNQENPPIGYGYGLRASYIGREWYVGHSGGLPGYGSHMSWSTTSGIGVIALGNVTYCRASTLCKEVLLSLQAESQRVIAKLPYGESTVIRRGQALLAAIQSGDGELPADLFSDNFPQDEEMTTLRDRLRAALAQRSGKPIDVKAERGFAGAICAGGEPAIFFSLAPAEGYGIQKIRFY